MRFIINKTSEWDDDVSPCSNAVKSKSSSGHTVWIIEMNTLKELIEFGDKQGQPLIFTAGQCGLYGAKCDVDGWLEIYDDYRE